MRKVNREIEKKLRKPVRRYHELSRLRKEIRKIHSEVLRCCDRLTACRLEAGSKLLGALERHGDV